MRGANSALSGRDNHNAAFFTVTHSYVTSLISSVTIRVTRRDKERLERLASGTGKKTLLEAFRLALSAAERETDSSFHGNIDALNKARESARSVGGDISENVDKELTNILCDEAVENRKRARRQTRFGNKQ